MERSSEERKKAEFQAAFEHAAENGDDAFATQLLLSRDTDPIRMLEWLGNRTQDAQPDGAVFWWRVIEGYAGAHLDGGSVQKRTLRRAKSQAKRAIEAYKDDPRSAT